MHVRFKVSRFLSHLAHKNLLSPASTWVSSTNKHIYYDFVFVLYLQSKNTKINVLLPWPAPHRKRGSEGIYAEKNSRKLHVP